MQHWKIVLFFAIGATAPVIGSAGVYKCTEEGKIIYSDKPCVDPEQRESGRMDNAPVLMGARRSSATSTALLKPTGPIDFGDNPKSKLIKVKAILESLEVDGRDCEWALKVDEKQLPKCITFMSQMLENAEWGQAMAVIQDLLNDEAFYKENQLMFGQLNRIAERVAGYSQFAKVRLAGSR